jgi:hypothetical protein
MQNSSSKTALITVLSLPAFLLLRVTDSGLGWISAISGFFFLFLFFRFLDNIGRRILVLDLVELLVVLQWVFAPSLYYLFYKYNLVDWQWWYYKMRVEPDEYFELAMPCSIAFVIGLRMNRRYFDSWVEYLFLKIRLNGPANFKVGAFLAVLGMVSNLATDFVSYEIRFVLTLVNTCLYTGVLYIFYSNHKARIPTLIALVVFILFRSVNSGMFGGAVWWPLLILMIISYGKVIPLHLKLIGAAAVFVVFSVLQSVKSQYRFITWRGVGAQKYQNYSNSEVLQALIEKRIEEKGFVLLDWTSYFSIVTRLNQGFHVSRTMKHTPSVQPFVYGETIITSIAASLVPRLFWPDKPEAGGRENYYRFTGVQLRRVSMNIGQIGDAYVNFTKYGAPVFLLLYALLLNYYLKVVVRLSKRRPSLLLWIPFLFIELLNVENDFFTTFNYALKGLIFLVVIVFFMEKGLKFKF